MTVKTQTIKLVDSDMPVSGMVTSVLRLTLARTLWRSMQWWDPAFGAFWKMENLGFRIFIWNSRSGFPCGFLDFYFFISISRLGFPLGFLDFYFFIWISRSGFPFGFLNFDFFIWISRLGFLDFYFYISIIGISMWISGFLFLYMNF